MRKLSTAEMIKEHEHEIDLLQRTPIFDDEHAAQITRSIKHLQFRISKLRGEI